MNRFTQVTLAALVCFTHFEMVSASEQNKNPPPTDTAWNPLPPLNEPLWETLTALIDDKIFVFGGFGHNFQASRHTRAFDLIKKSWTNRADLPYPLTHANAAIHGRSVWIAGGYEGNHPGKIRSEVWRYDIDLNKFFPGPNLPEARAGGGLAFAGKKLHYISGLKDRNLDAADHWTLDLSKGIAPKWEFAPALPVPRNQFGTVVLGSKIFVLGGQFGHDQNYPVWKDISRVDAFDLKTNSWAQMSDLPAPRSHFEAATFVENHIIYLIGGRNVEKISQDIWTYDEAKDSWRKSCTLPIGLLGPSARLYNQQFFVFGGGSPKAIENSTWTADAKKVCSKI